MFTPYTIKHIQLDQLKMMAPPDNNHYFVFWYRHFPLGHLWYNKGQNRGAFNHEVVNAITPALNYYSHAGEDAGWDWHSLLFKQDYDVQLFEAILVGLPKPKPVTESVTVVICTRNRPMALRNCIEQLMRSNDRDFELLVVDNASDTEETQRVALSFKGVKYVFEGRKGLDIARNTGIRYAKGSIVAFTDDDVMVAPDWISRIREGFENPLTMALTGLTIPVEIATEAQYLFETEWGFNKGYLPMYFDNAYVRALGKRIIPAWDVGAGANMAFRKDIFKIVGGFDERLDVGASGCSGDSEMWYRILAEGWSCFYVPQLVVYHQHRKTMAELRHQLYSYMKGHVSALMVQHEKYQHKSNIARIRRELPRLYVQRLYWFLRTLNVKHVRSLVTEIRGCIAGWQFYKANSVNRDAAVFDEPGGVVVNGGAATADTLVSVVITCYNYGHYLNQAIKSVRNQTHRRIQIVVVDDGSMDDTAAICASYSAVTYVKTPRVGVSTARNSGVLHCEGNYVIFLDADDYLYPEAVEKQLYFFNYFPEIAFVAGGFDRVDQYGNLIGSQPQFEQRKDDFYSYLLRGNFIGMQSNTMYRRNLFFDFYFDSKMNGCEDYDLNLRISRYYPAFFHIQKVAAYRVHEGGLSANVNLMKEQVLKALSNQLPYLRTPEEHVAYQEGKTNWLTYYTEINQEMNLGRTPQIPPKIDRVPDGIDRPLWSVMIPAYNCIGYLRETLVSVLQQALPVHLMQIEVIDDCSTDGDVAKLVDEVGGGRIQYFRKEKNGGSLRNFETCINRAKGIYVHILHGDDLVRPGFYSEVGELFTDYPQIGACCTSYDYIDYETRNVWPVQVLQEHRGIIDNWLERIACNNLVQPPSIVVKREVYERLGSFFAVHYGEDWEMWVRIAAHYPVAYSPLHLASYRVHRTNITTRSIITGQNVKDIRKVIRIISAYLPKDKRRKLNRRATRNFATYFAAMSDKIYHEHGKRKAALIQAYLSARMYFGITTVKQFGKIVFKCLINYSRG